jgi:hypothetical protein
VQAIAVPLNSSTVTNCKKQQKTEEGFGHHAGATKIEKGARVACALFFWRLYETTS